ncbi:MAG: prepilin peptidase [Lachnospiraceae bacterium]|nr:prepilin peptidase [Lachnospiraceae bacterium]
MFKMQIGSSVNKIVLIFFLGICAVFDIRKKEIPVILILIGIVFSSGINIWQIYDKSITIADAGAALIVGVFMICVSFCTRERIGYGDGLILIVSGLMLGIYQCFLGLCISLVFSSVCALFLLMTHKVDKDSGLPFVPFLTVGMGVSFFVQI